MGLFNKKKEETNSCCCVGNCTPKQWQKQKRLSLALG